MKNTVLALLLGVFFLAGAAAEQPAPVLRMPGSPDRPISSAALLGPGQQDVRVEESSGDVIIYHGQPLLETLEKAGLETRTMAGERKVAPAVVLATARDGYTVVFSVGELLMHRRDPRVFLVAETAGGPLPENEAPVRLIVYGDRVRSVYGLARIEMRSLAENRPTQAAPPRKP
jgi:hypothetical protein